MSRRAIALLALLLTGCATTSHAGPNSHHRTGTASAAAAGSSVASSSMAAAQGAPTRTAAPTLPTGVHSLVVLGDSVPAGSGSDAVPYPELVRRALAPTNPGIALTNLGSDGQTAGDLAQDLSSDRATRTAVAQADLVVITVGANDLVPVLDERTDGGCDEVCSSAAVRTAAAHLGEVVRAVQALDTRPGHRVVVTDYWHVFADGAPGRASVGADVVAWGDALTRAANELYCDQAQSAGATCVDLYRPFKGGGADPTHLLAPDGDHPNAAGHRVIADAVLAALRETR